MAQRINSPSRNGDYIIRKGTVEDYEQIFELIQAFAVFQKTPEKLMITLEQMQKDKDLFECFVVESDNTIIAFASFFFTYYSWSGKGLYLDDLYVTEAYRQQNIGKKLLDVVIVFAKAHQCKSVRWLVSRWNKNAINFYKKMGAETEETEMPCVYKLVY